MSSQMAWFLPTAPRSCWRALGLEITFPRPPSPAPLPRQPAPPEWDRVRHWAGWVGAGTHLTAPLPGTGVLIGPKCCRWPRVEKHPLLLTPTQPGPKGSLVPALVCEGSPRQQRAAGAAAVCPAPAAGGLGAVWVSGRVGSGRSALTPHVQPAGYFQHCSVFVFILYISASLRFRVGEEEFLDSVIFKTESNQTPHNQLLLFIQGWKLVNQK